MDNHHNGVVRRMPVRTALLTLAGDYEGFHATVRLNPPVRVLTRFGQGELESTLLALGELIVDWNFVDEQGEPLPTPAEGGLEGCPTELVQLMVEGYVALINERTQVGKA